MIIINATNLHVGGGVQVAAAFLAEVVTIRSAARLMHVFVSSEVAHELETVYVNTGIFGHYEVMNVHGLEMLFERRIGICAKDSVIFTIFGPIYKLKLRSVNVVGFAQAWIAYPDNQVYSRLSSYVRLALRLKFRVQGLFYRHATRLVVEGSHVKARLRAMGWNCPIDVVPNCLAGVYGKPDLWQAVEIPRALAGQPRIGIVTRDYIHKNLSVIPAVKRLLEDKFGLSVMFVVTFTESEWAARGEEFRASVVNVGPLRVAQCPSFYKQLDGVVFPSLLECFSATPLEALSMGVPLFASDRGFVRDVCGGAAHYFEPTDPESIARVIAEYYRRPLTEREAEPKILIDPQYCDPALRARRYIRILRQYAPELPDL